MTNTSNNRRTRDILRYIKINVNINDTYRILFVKTFIRPFDWINFQKRISYDN